MKLFGFNLSRASAALDSRPSSLRSKSLGPDTDAWLRGEEPGFSGPVLSNAFQQVVWVYRAITVLAEQIGNIPFLFSSGERGRENLITHGPLVDFYDHPHPQINRFEYWELRLIWLMLRGECFRIPIYDTVNSANSVNSLNSVSINSARKRLSRIIIPDPAHFQHIVEDHQLLGWRYTGFGPQTPLASQVFLPEEVWFEKLPNPFNFWRGLAPLQVAGLAAQTDFAAAAFMKGVLENNGDLGLIVKTKDQIGPEQREQLYASLRERKRRAGMADGPLLLWNAAEVIQPKLSSADLQFLENRKFSRAEICAAFGVPEEIVTTTDNSKYDVMQGARLNFIEHRVAPLCRRLEASEDCAVKRLDPKAVGWFDLDSLPIMQKAQRDRLDTARSVFDMGVPFNELNRVLDLGFRKLPWGDRGYIAARLVQVGDDRLKSKVQSLKSEENPEGTGHRHAPDSRTATLPLERMCGLLEEVEQRTLNIEPRTLNEGVPVPIHVLPAQEERPSLNGRVGSDAGQRARSETGAPSALRIPPSALTSRVRRFFFEQRGRVLGTIVGHASAPSPESVSPFDGEMECIKALKLPPEITASQAAELRERLNLETQTIRGAICDSLEEGGRNKETCQQLAERVRAIYNRKIDEVIERIVLEHQG